MTPGQWFTAEVIARGDHLIVKVDGKVTFDGRYDIRYPAGYFGMRLFTANTLLQVRKFEINELPPLPPESAFRPLFNGKDLDGWEGDKRWWSWKEDVLVGKTPDTGDVKTYYLRNSKTFRDFELKFQARVNKDPKEEFLHGVPVHVSVLVRGPDDVQGGQPGLAIGGKGLGSFSTRFGIPKHGKGGKNLDELNQALKPGFNDFYVRCVGKHVTLRINGVTTIDEDFPDLPDEGRIGFSMMSGSISGYNFGAEAAFRDMQIRELPPAEKQEPAFQPLFNGKDFDGWSPFTYDTKPLKSWTIAAQVRLDPADPARFVTVPGVGILVDNLGEQKTPDLCSAVTHGDCELHLEFNVPKHGASAIYLMGRYIVHLGDNFGLPNDRLYASVCGGLGAEGTAPKVNACAAPGTWQKLEIIFQAPRFDQEGKKTAHAKFVKVTLNGKVIQENVEIPYPDHGVPEEAALHLAGGWMPTAFRNIRLKKLNSGTATKPDTEILQGKWLAATAERDGQSVKELAGVKIAFDGDRVAIDLPRTGGQPNDKIEGTFRVDTTVSPKRLEIGSPDGKKTWRGVYYWNAEQLFLCLALAPDAPYPKLWGTTEHGHVSLTYHREGAPAKQPAGDFKPLFNGKDLDGWVLYRSAGDVNFQTVPRPKEAWEVVDGVLRRTGREWLTSLRTDKAFSDYVLDLEWRFLEEQGDRAFPFLHMNLHLAGVQPLGNIQGGAFELAVLPNGTGSLGAIAGATATERPPFDKLTFMANTRPLREWNRLTITAQGDTLEVAVNGATVRTLTDCKPSKGFISLRTGDTPLEFRNIRIKDLKAKEP